MLKKTVLWAVGFTQHLIAGAIASAGGFSVINPTTGEPEFAPPNPAAVWPPHRPHPTQKRHKRKSRHYPTTSIRQAMKRGGVNIPVANPGKYLHASRTAA